MRKRFVLLISGAALVFSAVLAAGFFYLNKKSVDIELTLLEKTYRSGQNVSLSAVIKSFSFQPIPALVNARIVGEHTDEVLNTYFPVLRRNAEYKLDFSCPVSDRFPAGQYRMLVKVMTYGDNKRVEDVVTEERSFTIAPRRTLSKKEIATQEALQSGKGIPIDADLVLYPPDQEDIIYGNTITLAGMFHNITYWDGTYKLVLAVVDPQGGTREFSDSFKVESGNQKEFVFNYELAIDKPEGRYQVNCMLYDDRKESKGYGKMINQINNSFSLIDSMPTVNIDQIALQVPGDGTYEFNVGARDDRGVKNVTLHYEFERKGMIKNLATLKKKQEENSVPMKRHSGDQRNGVWIAGVLMPPEGSKFVFFIEAEDTKGQIIKTDRYPMTVLKAVKKKKEEKKDDIEIKQLPGFEGYNKWEF